MRLSDNNALLLKLDPFDDNGQKPILELCLNGIRIQV